METAALLPRAIDAIAVDGPDCTSPPAKIPATLVSREIESTLIAPFSVSSTSLGKKDEFGACPTAKITVSTSDMNSEPLIGVHCLFPLSSGSPNAIRVYSMPVTLPSLPRILFGQIINWNFAPSFSASFCSRFQHQVYRSAADNLECRPLTSRLV